MLGSDAAAIGVGVFVAVVACLPFARLAWAGVSTSWITLLSIHLNRSWGGATRAEYQIRTAKARLEVLRSIHQSSINPVDPQFLEDIGSHLEEAAKRASKVVPEAPTWWLIFLVVAEALQYVAVPFAPGVPWNEDSPWGWIPQVFRIGLPFYNKGALFEAILWIVLSPLLLGVAFTFVGSVLAILFWGTKNSRCFDACTSNKFRAGYLLLTKIGVGLYVRLREVLLEFGTMLMFATPLMVFWCVSARVDIGPDIHCWKHLSRLVYVPVAMVQLLLQLNIIFSNNLPFYSIQWFWRENGSAELSQRLHQKGYFQKDGYMTFLSQAAIHEKGVLSEINLQVFDFQRPMFSSVWTALSGTLKFAVIVIYVFLGHKSECKWALLSGCAFCYSLLLFLNVQMAPCTYHWINCSRTIALAAGLWATSCGFVTAGIVSDGNIKATYIPNIVFLCGILLLVAVIPGLMLRVYHTLLSKLDAGDVLRRNVLHLYDQVVALFLLMAMRMSSDGVILPACYGEKIGIPLGKGIDVLRPTGILFRETVNRLKDVEHEWVAWNKKNARIGIEAFCTCCIWLLADSGEETDGGDIAKEDDFQQPGFSYLPPLRALPRPTCISGGRNDLMSASAKKVNRWMESADLIVDPSKDVELGLCVPFDAYLTINDGMPKHTGDSSHSRNVFPNMEQSRFHCGQSAVCSVHSATRDSGSQIMQESIWSTHSCFHDDEGPSLFRQTNQDDIGLWTSRAYDSGSEPLVPTPQVPSTVEKPQHPVYIVSWEKGPDTQTNLKKGELTGRKQDT